MAYARLQDEIEHRRIFDHHLPQLRMEQRLKTAVIEGVVAENVEFSMYFGDDVLARTTIGTLMDKARLFVAFLEKGTLVHDNTAPSKLARHPPGAPGIMPETQGEVVDFEDQAPLTTVIWEFAEVAVGRRVFDESLDIGISVVEILSSVDKQLALS